MPYCPYIRDDCEYMGSAIACATVSEVKCREKREKVARESEKEEYAENHQSFS